MHFTLILTILTFGQPQYENSAVADPEHGLFIMIDTAGQTIQTRFNPPEGFSRTEEPENSFAAYLRNLPLKPHGSKVICYDGSVKENYNVYEAVVDLRIGNKNLHQCADAVLRLKAEYLYSHGKYDSIGFNFTSGFPARYAEWRKGKRIRVEGNRVWWVQASQPSDSYGDFWKYLETVFAYAGTWSLAQELKPANPENLRIGNVFIRGGSPGHAVIVVDMAVNKANGKKVFLLAQSYMPAQEIQILKNPSDTDLSPWYDSCFGHILRTPEWKFYREELRRF